MMPLIHQTIFIKQVLFLTTLAGDDIRAGVARKVLEPKLVSVLVSMCYCL